MSDVGLKHETISKEHVSVLSRIKANKIQTLITPIYFKKNLFQFFSAFHYLVFTKHSIVYNEYCWVWQIAFDIPHL